MKTKVCGKKEMKELKENIAEHIRILCERYPALESVKEEIVEAYFLLAESYKKGGKLLVAGNGGSAADAEHIVGELMKGFKLPRKPDTDFADIKSAMLNFPVELTERAYQDVLEIYNTETMKRKYINFYKSL